jgi:hypothetical protein
VSRQYVTCFESSFLRLNFDVAVRCLADLYIPALWYETPYSECQFQLRCIFTAQLRNIHLLSYSRFLAVERVALLQDVPPPPHTKNSVLFYPTHETYMELIVTLLFKTIS